VETLDCAAAMISLGKDKLDAAAIEETLGCVLKSIEDFAKIKPGELEQAVMAGEGSKPVSGGD
ncbi:MAG: hypothetical protein ACREDR_49405, partial [Blastocatellia bacterium]